MIRWCHWKLIVDCVRSLPQQVKICFPNAIISKHNLMRIPCACAQIHSGFDSLRIGLFTSNAYTPFLQYSFPEFSSLVQLSYLHWKRCQPTYNYDSCAISHSPRWSNTGRTSWQISTKAWVYILGSCKAFLKATVSLGRNGSAMAAIFQRLLGCPLAKLCAQLSNMNRSWNANCGTTSYNNSCHF